jgi:carbon dioxide concentrating mechanism protein CcmN
VVDPSAVIAPGVVLQALPGASVHIGAYVCLGAGVVLQAKAGALVLEPGASLGVGVLVIGQGRIGGDACIGTATTLINPKIESGVVIPPNSLIGDSSRNTQVPHANGTHAHSQNGATSGPAHAVPMDTATSAGTQTVYGRSQVDSLLSALFPHRQADLSNGAGDSN